MLLEAIDMINKVIASALSYIDVYGVLLVPRVSAA